MLGFSACKETGNVPVTRNIDTQVYGFQIH